MRLQIWMRFDISYFDESKLQRIAFGVVSTLQDPDN